MMGFHLQLLSQFAFAQNANSVGGPLRQASRFKRLMRHLVAIVKSLIEIADVNRQKVLIPGGMTEAALGHAAEQLHLAAFKKRRWLLGAGTGPLAFAAARGGLAVAAARTTTHAFLLLQFVDAYMYAAKVHYRVTPRRRAVS